MGRAVLKSLKASTLLTFWEVCHSWGLRSKVHYKYDSTNAIIYFYNGSTVYLKDLKQYPEDPDFDSLGSTEYTGAFIDEGSQVSNKAKNILMSRLRFKLEEFNTLPKLLIASNPSKNFLYKEYYRPYKKGILEPYKIFIPALVGDNPYISPHYIENLKKLDKRSKERLFFGNWEYDDDPARLIEYDSIIDIFTNQYVEKEDEKKYIIVDPARFGGNYAIISLWYGLYIKKVWSFPKSSSRELRLKMEEIEKDEGIPRSCILVDEDGVGGPLIDEMPGIKGFKGGAPQIYVGREQTNYQNLRAQCYHKLALYVNKGKIGANIENVELKEMFIEDLEQVKRKNMDQDDKPFQIVSKDDMKEHLGRSPDLGDIGMMRMMYELGSAGRMTFLQDKENVTGLF